MILVLSAYGRMAGPVTGGLESCVTVSMDVQVWSEGVSGIMFWNGKYSLGQQGQ